MLHKITVTLGVLSLVVFMAGILLANQQVIGATTGMMLYALGGLLGLIAIILAVVVLFVSQHFFVAMVGLLGMLPLVALVGSASDALRYPSLNDVSTDLDDPPAFIHAPTLPVHAGSDLTFPEAFAPAIREHYPEVQPVLLEMDADQAYTRALRAAQDMPDWVITHEAPERRSFEAVATTRLFRWEDDVVVRVREEGGLSRIDARSRSRVGQSDLGANARRIVTYLDKLRLPARAEQQGGT